jgi:hypothetical protein
MPTPPSHLAFGIPVDPLSEVRVRVVEGAAGEPVMDFRLFRRSPADTSADTMHATSGGFTMPLGLVRVLLHGAMKTHRLAEEWAAWAREDKAA